MIKPLSEEENLTPNSSGRVAFVSNVPGTAVLGQIVHGQVGGGADAVIVMLSVACAVCTGLLESVT